VEPKYKEEEEDLEIGEDEEINMLDVEIAMEKRHTEKQQVKMKYQYK
jgi:hypothetical protein